jgi:hypothetical protein
MNLSWYPLSEESIRKILCICTKEYYSSIKKNEVMLFTGMRVELKIIYVKRNKPDA